jgi:Chitin synthase export chaperone
MMWIVVRRLREQRPFVYYVLAGILFMLAQLAYFLLSRPICSGTNAKIDGSFLATVLETASVIVLYLAWKGITEGLSISRQVCELMCSSRTFPAEYWGEDVYFQ